MTPPSNFSFCQSSFPDIYTEIIKAESHALSDPRTACFYARYSLELAVKWLYKIDRSLHSYGSTLQALIHEPAFKQSLAPQLFPKLLNIIKLGNLAVHDSKPVSSRESVFAVKELWHFTCWLYFSYTSPDKQIKIGSFNDAFFKKEQPKEDSKSREELQKLQVELETKAREADEALKKNKNLEDELRALQQELAEIKKANQSHPDTHDYSEAQTRSFFIDLLLREAGWDPDAPNVREYKVTGMPNESGQGFCDYVLWGDNGLPLAIVEAKRTTVDAKKGRQQAIDYANCLEKATKQRPIIFCTNGYEHFIWDDTQYPPRTVQGFYTKDQLQTLINRRDNRKPLDTLRVNQEIAGRYYQIEAIKAICESFSNKERKALVVMATGAGKTRTIVGLVDVLLRHNWIKKVLFLADRLSLVEQACGAFKDHLPNTTAIDLTKEKEDLNSRIMVSTYPSMMSFIDETKGSQKRFGAGYFDLVIIDDAHRSVYQKYKVIFEYFDALLVGLTATPRAESERDTYRLFDLQPGVPTFYYELEQAVADKYLVNARGIKLELGLPKLGLKYSDLTEDEKDQYENLFYDEEEQSLPNEIDGNAFNKWLFNKDTIDGVLKELMTRGIKIENGDKLGKTIIFARNHDHAEFIYDRFNVHYPKYAGHFCRVIDYQEKSASSLLKTFKGSNSLPQIAISVDMLDTGVDIPEVVNLVFFKPVFSKVKFLQMLGRGTRPCKDLFGQGIDKKDFLVFDVCGNFEYFESNPQGVEGSNVESLSEKLFKRRLEIAMLLKTSEVEAEKLLRTELLDRLHNEVLSMNPDNFLIRPKLRVVDIYRKREKWDSISESDMSDIVYNLANLPNEMPLEDIDAKKFDLLMFSTELAMLNHNYLYDGYIKRIRKIASELEDKRNIPMVEKQLELIESMQTDEYWQDITVPMLDSIRKKLRDLLKFIDRHAREIVYSDFVDGVLGVHEIRNIYGIDDDLPLYKEKVQQFIRDQDNTIVIHKIKHNQPITKTEITQLESMLFESPIIGSKEKFEKAFGKQDQLGLFVRKLVGLDRNAAKEAFTDFIQTHELNTIQIRFVDYIINFLTQNGVMEIGSLYEPPFTDLNDSGIDGVFSEKDADAVVEIVRRFEYSLAANG